MPDQRLRGRATPTRLDGPLAGLAGTAAHLRYGDGETIAEIATAFAIDWEEAAHWLRDHGTFTVARVTLTPHQAREIEQRVLDVGAAAPVAAHLGLAVEDLSCLLGRRAPDPRTTHVVDRSGDIVAHYEAGHSTVRIAADFGLTLKAVSDVLTGRGVRLRDEDAHADGSQPLSAQQKERIVARYREGIPDHVIAREMGTSRAAVLAALRDGHLELPTPEQEIARLTPVRVQQILACCEDAAMPWQVAAQFAVSVSAIQLLIRQHRTAEEGSPWPRVARKKPDRQDTALLERVVVAHFMEGLSPEQIIDRFGVPPARVTGILRRHHLLPAPARRNRKPAPVTRRPRKQEPVTPSGQTPAMEATLGLDGQSRFDPTLLAPPAPPPAPPPRTVVPPVPMPQWSDPGHAAPSVPPAALPAQEAPLAEKQTPGLPPMFSEAQADEIVTRYQAGESTTALGKAFGASGATVAKALRSRHVPVRARGGQPSVSAEQEDAIVAAYRDGDRPHLLAARFGLSDSVIAAVLDRHGIPRPGSRRVFTDPQLDEVVTRYQAGASIEQVAAHFGVSAGAVTNALDLRNVPRRSKTSHVRRALTDTEAHDAAEFYRSGESVGEIARAFGVHRSTIDRVLRNQNVPRKRTHGCTTAATEAAPTPTPPQPDGTNPPSSSRAVLTPEQRQSVADRYRDGEDATDLAAAFQVSKRTIYRTLDDAQIPRHRSTRTAQPATAAAPPRSRGRGGKGKPRPSMRALTEQEADAVILRYRAGAAITQIAREFDVGATTVRAVLVRRGEPLRSRGGHGKRLSESQIAVAVARFRAGTAIADLANALDVSEPAVTTALAQALPDFAPPATPTPPRRRRTVPRTEGTGPRRRGQPRRQPAPRPRRLSTNQIDDLVYRYADGASVTDLAADFGTEVEVIARALRGRGVPDWALRT